MRDSHLSLTIAICVSLALHVFLLRQAGEDFVRGTANYRVGGYYGNTPNGRGRLLTVSRPNPADEKPLPIYPIQFIPLPPEPTEEKPKPKKVPTLPPEVVMGEEHGTGDAPQSSTAEGELASPLTLENNQAGLSRDEVGPGKIHDIPSPIVAPQGKGPMTAPPALRPMPAMQDSPALPAIPAIPPIPAAPQEPSRARLPADHHSPTDAAHPMPVALQGDPHEGQFGLPAESRVPSPRVQPRGNHAGDAKAADADQASHPDALPVIGLVSDKPKKPDETASNPIDASAKDGDPTSPLTDDKPTDPAGKSQDTKPAKTDDAPVNPQVALADESHPRPDADYPIVDDPTQAAQLPDVDPNLKPSNPAKSLTPDDAASPDIKPSTNDSSVPGVSGESTGSQQPAAPGSVANPNPGVPAHVADPLPKSPSESDPFAQKASAYIVNGRVIAREGREVHTTSPRLLLSGRVAVGTNDELITTLRLICDPTGQVVDVMILRSSGFDELDQPLMLCAYEWWVKPLSPAKGESARPFTIVMSCRWK